MSANCFLKKKGCQHLNIEGSVNYAYKFKVEKYKVAIGLTTEYEKYSIDNGTVTNPFFDANDNVLLDAIEGIAFFDATFGIYADYEDKFFFGISFPNLIRARLTDVLSAEESEESGLCELRCGRWS